MNKSKINKYKINNNNNTNKKHEFNVKYERYKQDISKDTLQMQKKLKKNPHIFAKLKLRHVDCLAFKKLQITQVL
jgi:site-specific DNA-adenine methylase